MGKETSWELLFFLMPFKAETGVLNLCYKTCVNAHKICIIPESPYLCIVFFIVLDLRLTKVGVQRNSFFYAHTFPFVFMSDR